MIIATHNQPSYAAQGMSQGEGSWRGCGVSLEGLNLLAQVHGFRRLDSFAKHNTGELSRP
jgi:hypothetical protein